MGSSRSHTVLQTLCDVLCRKDLHHNPKMLLCPGDCEGQQWYEGQTPWTGLVQRQANTPPVLWTLHRALQVNFKPQVWQTAWGGLVLQQDHQCGSTLHALMEDYIPSTHQLQMLVREVLRFWSPEKLPPTTQLTDASGFGGHMAGLPGENVLFSLFTLQRKRRMDKGVG